jgi:hypothetical protein
MSTNISADRIEQLNLFAVSDKKMLEAQGCEKLFAWLQEFVELELQGIKVPIGGSVEYFSSLVQELVLNKKAWAQRLGSLIIALNENTNTIAKDALLTQLSEFSNECPWLFLRRSAAL